MSQFPSGHSNLTYLVEGGGKQLVLRRPPFGAKVKTAHDMGREYRILSRLHAVYPPAPRPVAYTEDTAIIGAPFYVMERIVGVILRRDPPAELLPPETARGARARRSSTTWRRCTGSTTRAAGLGDLGKPEGYVERQVRGWAERYRNARTDDIPDMEFLEKWLVEHMPQRVGRGAHPQRLQVRQPGARGGRSDAHHRRPRLGDVDHRRSADGSGHRAELLGARRRSARRCRRCACAPPICPAA